MEKETYKKAKEILEKFATVSELCRHNFITSCHFFGFHLYVIWFPETKFDIYKFLIFCFLFRSQISHVIGCYCQLLLIINSNVTIVIVNIVS